MIGNLDQRITIVNPERKPNGRGGWSTDYGAAATRLNRWASFEVLTINQRLRYQEFNDAANVRFFMRHTDAVKADSQIEHDGKVYRELQIGPAQKMGYLEIRAREA